MKSPQLAVTPLCWLLLLSEIADTYSCVLLYSFFHFLGPPSSHIHTVRVTDGVCFTFRDSLNVNRGTPIVGETAVELYIIKYIMILNSNYIFFVDVFPVCLTKRDGSV